MKTTEEKQIAGCLMLIGLGFICVALGAATHWAAGVALFGVIVLAMGIIA